MSFQTITKKEIDSLYKKLGIYDTTDSPSKTMNLGTLNNRLANRFVGAKEKVFMQGQMDINSRRYVP